jgi:hypothetical protein
MASGLPLVRSGAVLHMGDYCHFMQVVTPGNNTLPVENGCQFHLTKPADVFATDGGDYSVSEVVGSARIGVAGPADARVMAICRLSPRVQFWFWISADGSWNVDRVVDVHHPTDLVSADQELQLRQYLKTGLNDIQFKCAGGATSHSISLALNVNDHQFAALTVEMPSPDSPLDRPSTPWFVDVAARLTTGGTLDATAALVTLYDGE